GESMRTARRVGICALLWTVNASGARGEESPQALADKARAVLKTYCARCHGQDGANEGGFNYATDLRRLVDRRKVIPGEPGKSRLLRGVRDAADPMRPAEEKLRPNKDVVAALERWIQAGAPAAETAARAPVTAADVHELIRKDLDAAPPRDRPFLRYFTLAH